MNFAPATMPMWAISQRTRYTRHIAFTFGDEAVRELLDEEIDSAAFVPRVLFHDPALLHIARLFDAECQATDAWNHPELVAMQVPTPVMQGDDDQVVPYKVGRFRSRASRNRHER
jgi:pimeloyl-ACP methyl ester carboxylesterase